MYMPKNFVSELYGMSLPANVTCGVIDFLFCGVWKDIANVFSVFILSFIIIPMYHTDMEHVSKII